MQHKKVSATISAAPTVSFDPNPESGDHHVCLNDTKSCAKAPPPILMQITLTAINVVEEQRKKKRGRDLKERKVHSDEQ